MISILRPAVTLFVGLSLLTGLAYPLLTTGIAKVVFPAQGQGSLVQQGGKVVGSSLIGQPFSDPKYFWSRPSATSPISNNASASGGSDQGPLNPALIEAAKGRIEALRAADPANKAPVPADLVTAASASGLDPHIWVAAAQYQAARLARVRQMPAERAERTHLRTQRREPVRPAGRAARERAVLEPGARRATGWC